MDRAGITPSRQWCILECLAMLHAMFGAARNKVRILFTAPSPIYPPPPLFYFQLSTATFPMQHDLQLPMAQLRLHLHHYNTAQRSGQHSATTGTWKVNVLFQLLYPLLVSTPIGPGEEV